MYKVTRIVFRFVSSLQIKVENLLALQVLAKNHSIGRECLHCCKSDQLSLNPRTD